MGSDEKYEQKLKMDMSFPEDEEFRMMLDNIVNGSFERRLHYVGEPTEQKLKEEIVNDGIAIEKNLEGTDNPYLLRKVHTLAYRIIEKLSWQDNFLQVAKEHPQNKEVIEFNKDVENIREIYERLVNGYDPDSTEQHLKPAEYKGPKHTRGRG